MKDTNSPCGHAQNPFSLYTSAVGRPKPKVPNRQDSTLISGSPVEEACPVTATVEIPSEAWDGDCRVATPFENKGSRGTTEHK